MENKYEFLKTGTHEFIKSYLEYDTGRMVTVYEARANAVNGDYCLKTEYVYDGISTRVIKMKETPATWNSAWDI